MRLGRGGIWLFFGELFSGVGVGVGMTAFALEWMSELLKMLPLMS